MVTLIFMLGMGGGAAAVRILWVHARAACSNTRSLAIAGF